MMAHTKTLERGANDDGSEVDNDDDDEKKVDDDNEKNEEEKDKSLQVCLIYIKGNYA